MMVLNANTLAVSEYDIAALDVVAHDGEVFFVSPTGLSKLDATGAETFASDIQTGDLSLVPDGSANVAFAYVETAADGAMTLTATADQDASPRLVAYVMPFSYPAGKPRVSHVRLGRGVVGNAWSFKIGATGAWSLSRMSVGVDRMRRRMR